MRAGCCASRRTSTAAGTISRSTRRSSRSWSSRFAMRRVRAGTDRERTIGDAPAGVPATPGVHELPDGRQVVLNVDTRESSLSRVTAQEFTDMLQRVDAAAVRGRAASAGPADRSAPELLAVRPAADAGGAGRRIGHRTCVLTLAPDGRPVMSDAQHELSTFIGAVRRRWQSAHAGPDAGRRRLWLPPCCSAAALAARPRRPAPRPRPDPARLVVAPAGPGAASWLHSGAAAAAGRWPGRALHRRTGSRRIPPRSLDDAIVTAVSLHASDHPAGAFGGLLAGAAVDQAARLDAVHDRAGGRRSGAPG